MGADIGRHALERHDSGRTRILRNSCLLRGDNVHDDATLEHVSQSTLDARRGASLFILLFSHSSHHDPKNWSKTRAIFRVLH